MEPEEKKKLFRSLPVPVLMVLMLWIVKFVEIGLETSFAHWGISPRQWSGLPGLVFSPLLHSGFKHLLDNTLSLFMLSVTLFYFYREIAIRVLAFSWIITGVWVWAGAREAYHIGASGIVYSLASFLFFSGIIRRHTGLMSISLLVTFLYGGMVWGIFPLKEEISWESHLFGGFSGLLLALIYSGLGPRKRIIQWEDPIVPEGEKPYWEVDLTDEEEEPAKKEKPRVKYPPELEELW
jgi:membrane associated rhomboid family serine protease